MVYFYIWGTTGHLGGTKQINNVQGGIVNILDMYENSITCSWFNTEDCFEISLIEEVNCIKR